jgi:hypothetical protein
VTDASGRSGGGQRGATTGWGRVAVLLVSTVVLTTCQLDKLVGPPASGSLTVSINAVEDSAAVGSAAARTTALELGSSGPGTLSWTATLANGSAWLTLGASSGTAPTSLSATLDPQGLAVGTHRDTILLTAAGGSAQLTRIPVEFTIVPCRVESLTSGATLNDSLTTSSCGAPHAVGRFARLFGFSADVGDSVTIGLSSTAFDGFLIVDSSASGTGVPLAQEDNCRGVTGDACLPYLLLPETGDYVVEVTSSTAGQTGVFSLTFSLPRPPDAPTQPAQRQTNGGASIPVGATVLDSGAVLAALISDPDGDSVRLEVEVQPIGTPFAGSPTDSSGYVESGEEAAATTGPLTDDTGYHWQYRARDETGRTSPWVAFGGNGESAPDFRIAVPEGPSTPAGLGQLRSDGTTAVALGAVVPEGSLVFSGVLQDVDAGDQLRLEVEVRPVGTPFTGTPTGSSVPVTSGQTAAATIAGLPDDTEYHWRARTTDQSGLSSGWVSFGGNAETDTDFAVAVPATRLEFRSQPTTTAAGLTIVPAVEVAALEASGVVDTAYAAAVQLARTTGAGTPGATLLGTTSLVPTAGISRFTDLAIDSSGTGYSLTATSPGLTSAVSNTFDITEGAATFLAITQEPSDVVAGQTFDPPIAVAARDAQGNLSTDFTGDVTIAIVSGTGAPGATLQGTTTVGAVGGQAIFADLNIQEVGQGYRLVVFGPELAPDTSVAFSVSPAPAARLLFSGQPADGTAGNALSPPIEVTAVDPFDNVATGFAGTVTLRITPGTGTPGAQLTGTIDVAAQSGVALFPDLVIDSAGVDYTLDASATGLTGATSVPFSVSEGGATQLAFRAQPSTTTAGVTIAPAVEVVARDAVGNLVLGFTGTVAVEITAGTGGAGAQLFGSTSVDAVGGVATFSDLSIRVAGAGYTLTARSTGLTDAVSAPFDIAPATPVDLRFTWTPPASVAAGDLITPAPQVTAFDAYDNVATGFGNPVTLAIAAGTGTAGAALGGVTTISAMNGVAAFGSVSIDSVGTGYRLQATSTGLPSPTSAAFDVTEGAANGLAFVVQPTTTSAGAILDAVQVAVQDGSGNTVTGFSGDIIVDIAAGTGTAGAQLSGTRTQPAVSGVATFADLSIDLAGTGYRLNAAAVSGGVTGATSATFDITAGAVSAQQSLIAASPQQLPASTGGITSTITVSARDPAGNPVPGVPVVLSATGSGNILTQPATVTDANGEAVGTLASSVVGDKVVTAEVDGVLIDANVTVTVIPGPATRLQYTTEPQDAVAGEPIPGPPTLTAFDQFGNVATSYASPVTLSVVAGSGTAGAHLLGDVSVTASAGVAAFGNVTVDSAGTGYRVAATAGGLTPDTSGAFAVAAGTATQLVFVARPPDTEAGQEITPAPQIRALDQFGNLATGFSANVSLQITPGSGTAGAVLAGTTTRPAVSGLATFPGLSIALAGSAYRLDATSGTLTARSGQFDILVGPPSQVAFTVQPQDVAAGAPFSVQAAVQDAAGNTVPTATNLITVEIADNPGGGTLSGTTARNAVNGIATFSGLSIDKAGVGYRLRVTATGLTPDTSLAFTVGLGAPDRLVITQQPPATVIAGEAITPPLVATVQDASGNTVTSYTGQVTAALGANPGGATLSGTLTVSAVAGIAAFSNLRLDKAASGYSLDFDGQGVPTGATTTLFTVVPAAPAALLYVQQPTTTVAGDLISPPVRVAVRDAFGNTVTSSTAPLTIEITSGTGTAGATLSGTTTVNAVAGEATFADLSIDRAGTGYTLSTSGAGVPAATSTGFDVVVGGGNRLVFITQPSNTAAGSAISPSVQVEVQDDAGNRVTTATNAITVAIGSNPGGSTLAGTLTRNAVNGVATFNDLRLDKVGVGYTLTAGATGLSGAASNPFDIVPGAATQLVFTQQPTDVTAGAAISPAVTVTVRDASGNTVTGYTTAVGLAIGANPGGGTLTGGGAVTPTNGVATFPALQIDKTGSGYTLVATSGGLSRTSAAFDVDPGTPADVVFVQQPTDVVAGAAISPAVTVAVRDVNGNVVTAYTGSVTADLGANPGGATLGGTRTVTAVAGVATFANLTLDKAASGYTLTASADGVTGEATSVTFAVTPAGASVIVFAQQPSNTVAGQPITPAVRVAVRDAFGNTVTTDASSITVAIGTNPSGGTLSGTLTRTAVNGVAEFADLSIDMAGNGYTLVASRGGLPNRTSTAFDNQVGTGNRLAFVVQPSSAQVGAAITPAVQVEVQDGAGNRVTSATDAITMVIGTNPSGGMLSGPTTVDAVSGVATFNGLRISAAGTGYTLTALASGLVSTSSTPFNITTAATTTTITNRNPTASVTGQSVTVSYVVSVNAPGSGTPTGTVTVSAGPDSCSGSVAAGSCVITFQTAGTKSLTATYAGDANFGGSTSAPVSHLVSPAATTTQLTAHTPDPSVTGQPITVIFTVAVTSPGGGTPGGTVTVTDGEVSCAGSPAAGTCQLTPIGAGSITLTATYAGDADYLGSSDAEAHLVNKANTTVAITSDTPDPSVVGQPVSVSYVVTVASPGAGTPTGSVTVSDGTASCIGTVAAGSCSLAFATPGTKSITAAYAGDSDFNGNTSPAVTNTVGKAASTTTITSDLPDPSVTGQLVTVQFSVVATPPGSGTPGGTVTVSDGTNTCSASVSQGSCQLALTSAGAQNLTATYGGDANFAGSSDDEPHQVSASPTTTSITDITPSPTVFGGSATVSYTVTASGGGGGTPSGSVTVSTGDASCVGPVTAGSCVITFASAGTKTVTATYAGNADYASSSGSTTHEVTRAPSTVTITSDSPDPSTVGQPVTVNFTVTSTAGTPTGNVTVSDGTDACAGTVAAGTCQLTPTTTGAKTLTASYAGDENFAPTTSPGVGHQVNPLAAPVITAPANGAVTNDNTPTITGTADPNVTIEVFDGAASLGTTPADGAGNWALTPAVGLTDGSHTVTAVATVGGGNESPASSPVTITVDTQAPGAPVITVPAEGSTTNDNTPTISGTAEVGASVAVLVEAGGDGDGEWGGGVELHVDGGAGVGGRGACGDGAGDGRGGQCGSVVGGAELHGGVVGGAELHGGHAGAGGAGDQLTST